MTQATQTQTPEFRNIITTAFGFINRLRSVETDDGEYLSLVFNAQYGKKDKNGKYKTSRFSLNVKSSEVEDILRDVMQDYSPDDDKLCASLHIGDIRPHLVTNPDGSPLMVDVYSKGKKTGKKEPLVEIRGSLIGMNYLSKNSEVLVKEVTAKSADASVHAEKSVA